MSRAAAAVAVLPAVAGGQRAQRCLHGRYTAVQLVSPDLIGENEEAARVLNALASVG